MKPKQIVGVENLWKTYHIGDNSIDVLKGISFSINQGEFVSIIGKSGSGKTTLVNQIGCLDQPSKGKITISGENVLDISENKLARIRGREIGYIFQKFNLIKSLSALENVEIPMIFQDVEKEERVQRAEFLLKEFDMGERLINKPSELSGGQQQRVAIARALSNDPSIIIADEPTGNLDSKTGVIVMNYLRKLHEKGKTILLITHDDKLANYAQRIITLKDGELIGDKQIKK